MPTPVNATFLSHVQRTSELFAELLAQSPVPISGSRFPNLPAIYIFYLDGVAVHVGRTRSLGSRIRGHVSNSHFSASYAFKRARKATGMPITYRPAGSRSALMLDADFRIAFHQAVAEIRTMTVRYLEVRDPIDQYLLELYAAIELRTSLTEFDTH